MPSAPPEPGQIVIVRQRPFVVSDVHTSTLPLPATIQDHGVRQHLVRLSSVEDEGLGEELSVVWELEPGVVCLEKAQLPALTEFDVPRTFDAFLDTVAWGCVSSADDRALQAPFRSGVEVDDYQLDPVVRALSMPRVNLLVADDVGLGKTIEAGLVMQELILRHRARSILIVCPSSIQVQWKEEMRDKFGLDFRIVDSALLADLRRRRGIHVNPWAHFPRLITSIDFLKRERPMRLFRETLPAGDQPRYPRPYDLLIVDEAHNVAPSGRGKCATDSMRTAAIRTLAPCFEHKLFLSATPHNGYSESFSALLELLDNQRFARATRLNRAQLEAVMVRRMKSDPGIAVRWDGQPRFARRCVKHLEVPYTEAERRTHQTLRRYAELRVASAATAGQHFATEFVLKLLKKRLFSSPAAFAGTLEKHARSVATGRGGANGTAWQRQVEEADNDYANDEDYEALSLEAIETASRHVTPLAAEEKQLLAELREFATGAASRADSKARRLIEWLRAALKVEAIREDLGKVGPVIAEQVEQAMLGKRRTLDTTRAEQESAPVRAMLKFERKLREQLQKLTEQLHDTERELRLSPVNIQNVVTTGLALAGQPPLRPASIPGRHRASSPSPPSEGGEGRGEVGGSGAFHLPLLTGSWALCAEGLAHPHTHQVRPIVFDHALATGRDDVVLCHLNHRLVQMCLRLLRAEVWSQGLTRKLNRFTARMVPDSALQTPAVILHGRLLVLGGDNQRVHEEIIVAGGFLREGRFSRMNVGETHAAAAAATAERPPGFIEDRLKELWHKVQAPLLQALEARMTDRTRHLQNFLDDRSEREVANVTAIMQELERSIRETLETKDDLQMQFDWTEVEKQQRERDIGSLRARLAEIPGELQSEVEHLRARYQDPQPRLFPVAVTFLVQPRAVAALQQGGGR